MAKNRELSEVLEQMMLLVPQNEPLLVDLKKVHSSARFASPELMPEFWAEAQTYLQQSSPPDPQTWEPWRRQICNIFCDRPLDSPIVPVEP